MFQSPTIRVLKIISVIFQVVAISACLFLFADYADNKGRAATELDNYVHSSVGSLNSELIARYNAGASQDALLIVGCLLICGIAVIVWLLCDIAQSLRFNAEQQVQGKSAGAGQ